MATRSLAYICKRCHNYDKVDITFAFKDISDPEELCICNNKVNYICPVCGNYTGHYMVDADIAKSISLMNKLGYKTVYSCSGHYEMKKHRHISGPYIMVKGNKVPNPNLVYDLVAIGFDDWTIGQDSSSQDIDISKEKDVEKLLKSTTWSFHWNWRVLIDEEIKFNVKYNYDMNKVVKEMRRYIKRINNKLNVILVKYLQKEEEA